MENFKIFFEQNYQGTRAFIREIIKPLFGEMFTQADENILNSYPNLKPAAERANIMDIHRFGTCDLDVPMDFFDITLTDRVHLSQSRVYIQQLLRQVMQTYSAALIVFHYADNQGEWRVSYVSKGSNATDATSAKRYTYLMGENQKCRTAAERFAILMNKEKTEANITEAFSVEKVSKQFFDEYKKQYDIFCNYMLSKPGIRQAIFNGDDKVIRDFNKKLLGRIVFLYFIQKKGWLGVALTQEWGNGDFDFLANLFNKCVNRELFYSEYLSKLFFDTLNTPRINDIIELIPGESCKIPFLNGGLFEEDDQKQRLLNFPAKLFKDLFDFFNQYNFTIYEDDPNDHTVAVDPEMLGHIFENLLEDNKDKGAFYTPKEIVHYMCQESLIEYLCTTLQILDEAKEREAITKLIKTKEIDDILKSEIQNINNALDMVKICDPAIGSGAFPMGLLHEIYGVKQTLFAYEKGDMLNFDASAVKLNIIQNSIYGVDIEKGAVDIARLRFWLSLIVDEPAPKTLPNLDYKIVVGNSLVSKLRIGNEEQIIDINWGVKQNQGKAEEYNQKLKSALERLSEKQKQFFSADHKDELKHEIRNLKIEILIHQLSFNKELFANKNVIKTDMGFGLRPSEIKANLEISLTLEGFNNSIHRLEKLKNQPDISLCFFDWKLDFPEIMNEQVAEKVGFDIVIGNPPYNLEENIVLKEYYKLKYKTLHFKINLFACFIEQGFSLLNNYGIFSYIIPNLLFANDSLKLTRKYFLEKSNPIFFMNLGDNIFQSATVPTMIFMTKMSCIIDDRVKIYSKVNNIENLTDSYFETKKESLLTNYNYVIETSNPIIAKILRKIEGNSDILENHLEINQGIITGNDNKFLSKTKESLIWKQTIRGKDIVKYNSNLPNLFVKYAKEELACPRTIDLFETEKKLLMRRTGDAPVVALDEKQTYNLHTLYSIRSKNKNAIEFYLCLLNSNLFKFIYQQKLGTEIGRTFAEIKIVYIRQLPILRNIPNVQKIINTVNEIISNKKIDIDTSTLEHQIDNLVYKLYDLTYEEVKVVDPDFGLSEAEYATLEIE